MNHWKILAKTANYYYFNFY